MLRAWQACFEIQEPSQEKKKKKMPLKKIKNDAVGTERIKYL